MSKKIFVPLALLAVVAVVMLLPKKGGNNLEAKRRGETPLSDAEAQNYLNTYSDLAPYYNAHPHLASEFGNMIEWGKWHWANYGRHEGRNF